MGARESQSTAMRELAPAGGDGRLERIAEAIREGRRPIELVGAGGGFAGFLLAALRRLERRRVVVVAPNEERARDIALALELFEPPGGALSPVAFFETLDHSPWTGMSPSRTRVMDRVSALARLVHDLDLEAMVVPAPALLDRVIPRASLSDQVRMIAAEDTIDRDELLSFLASAGYHSVPAVEDPGTFAVRGGIVDVFSPMYAWPVRIDLWGDVVDSLRFFDPTTQQSLGPSSTADPSRTADDGTLDEVFVGPARDVLFTDDAIRRARGAFHELADARHAPTSRARALIEDVESGILGVGMEDLLPAFHPHLDTLFDVVPDDALWVVDEPERCREALRERWEDLAERGRAAVEEGRMAYGPEELHLPAEEAAERLGERTDAELVAFSMADRSPAVSMRFDAVDNDEVRKEIERATEQGDEEVLAPLTRRVREWRAHDHVVVVCAHTEGSIERLAGLLGHYGTAVERHVPIPSDADEGADTAEPAAPTPDDAPAGTASAGERFHLGRLDELRARDAEVHLFLGDPGRGFRSEELGLVLLDESEILGQRKRRARRRHARASPEATIEHWRDLHEGDHVVHLQHGIGRYEGLTRQAVGGAGSSRGRSPLEAIEMDFLVLAYAGDNKLFVPVDKLHLVSKYTPADDDHAEPRLDKLGGTAWDKRKSRVRKAVRDIADKLLRLYAERELAEGHAFSPPDETFRRFEAAFPWEETPDQARAIEATLSDMQRRQPMDRLICGDVGFGKTEVALRAAMLAILDGKQVAVLVPTVVLAEQHRMTFEERFEGFPVTIDTLTRTRSDKEARDIRQRLADGRLDVVVGTHKLLSRKVDFNDLGLLVLDEEHRFGVAHKELLKQYAPNVDVMTLTATPIPRTLHMAMVDLRDISLIQTPPVDRLAVHTLVSQPTEDVLREAILREVRRGGQVFYLHNRVEDIDRQAELVQQLVPEARVEVAHGQMSKHALEQTMLRFMHGEFQVLVCTTIIESGLDIPNANTILINRAHRYGLAQLYQLRGRVGRSNVRAYCYLLVAAPQNLSGEAAQRIGAIQRFTELGSGFSIASYDLDIRGAGDILGADQAGRINEVGYEAYMELLREAIDERSGGERARLRELPEPEMNVAVEARIPERWLPDTTLRLRLYKQLASADGPDEVYQAQRVAVDRYGTPPQPVRNLVELMALKKEAHRLGLASVSYSSKGLSLGLSDDERSPLGPERVAALLQRKNNPWHLTSDHRLTQPVTDEEWQQGLETLRAALRDLAEFVESQERLPAL